MHKTAGCVSDGVSCSCGLAVEVVLSTANVVPITDLDLSIVGHTGRHMPIEDEYGCIMTHRLDDSAEQE